MSTTLKPVITQQGITALINAKEKGVKASITRIAVGDGAGANDTPLEEMTALQNEIQRSVVAGGELLGSQQNQLHLTATIQDQGERVPEVYPIHEIGFFLETGELFAIYASPEEKLAEKIAGTDFVLAFDLTLTGANVGDIVVDGTGEVAMPLARDNILMGENTVKIHTQAEFDRVFNLGEETEIPENTTIVLSPIQDTSPLVEGDETANMDLDKGASGGIGDAAHNTYNGRPAYILKNSLQVKSGVSISGFNQEDTLVIKNAEDVKIYLTGESDSPVRGVKFSGWAFDGRGGVNDLGGNFTAAEAGGALVLAFAEHCHLDCKIVNHCTGLSGGGIFSHNGVSNITATQLHQNKANIGGGVFGCNQSTLTVYSGIATSGGSGVFGSIDSEIRVFNCAAENCTDGIAYRDNGVSSIGVSESLVADGEATFNSKLTFAGNLSTKAIEKITPFLIRGTGGSGKNGDAPRILTIGDKNIFTLPSRKGLALTQVNRLTHAVIKTRFFDFSATPPAATPGAPLSKVPVPVPENSGGASEADLAKALNTLGNDEIGVLTSYDSWHGQSNSALRKAFKARGLYRALSLFDQQAENVPYAAIFDANKNSCASEAVSSNDAGSRFAELNGWLMDGSFVSSGNAQNALLGHSDEGSVLGAYVDHKGQVGIGTDIPQAKLDVRGELAVHGELAARADMAVKGKINVSGGFNIGGEKPFLWKQFSGFRVSKDTGKSTAKYTAIIVGFVATGGDINENGSGTIIKMQMRKNAETGTWFIFSDFRSHKNNEKWDVDVLFINKKLVAEE